MTVVFELGVLKAGKIKLFFADEKKGVRVNLDFNTFGCFFGRMMHLCQLFSLVR